MRPQYIDHGPGNHLSSACPRAGLQAALHARLSVRLLAGLPTCLVTGLPACHHAGLPAGLLASLPAALKTKAAPPHAEMTQVAVHEATHASGLNVSASDDAVACTVVQDAATLAASADEAAKSAWAAVPEAVVNVVEH